MVNQCLNVGEDEHVVIVNDGNDQELVDALIDVARDEAGSCEYLEYEQPDRSGVEPPAEVVEALAESDVFIAPTVKSLSHTRARRNATDAGARGATMPGVNRAMWNTSLRADYNEVARICRNIMEVISGATEATIKTPSGTDLSLEIEERYYMEDNGLIHEPGGFGNLPAGETFGAPVNASGTLIIDHFPIAPEGTRVEIRDNRAVSIEHPDGEGSELAETFEEVDGARNLAEFGIGANPEAALIGTPLQDEKVLGTVHFAFGNNAAMVPEGEDERVDAEFHDDSVCENPTVLVDGETLLEDGEPHFT